MRQSQQNEIGHLAVFNVFGFRDYVTDDGDFSDDDLIDSKEKTGSSKCPIRPCACVPDYILLSGGRSVIILNILFNLIRNNYICLLFYDYLNHPLPSVKSSVL